MEATTYGPAEGVRRNTEHELRFDRRLSVGERERRNWSCICGQFALTEFDAPAKGAYRVHFKGATA